MGVREEILKGRFCLFCSITCVFVLPVINHQISRQAITGEREPLGTGSCPV